MAEPPDPLLQDLVGSRATLDLVRRENEQLRALLAQALHHGRRCFDEAREADRLTSRKALRATELEARRIAQ